jgi:hypothetical protein
LDPYRQMQMPPMQPGQMYPQSYQPAYQPTYETSPYQQPNWQQLHEQRLTHHERRLDRLERRMSRLAERFPQQQFRQYIEDESTNCDDGLERT